MCTALLPPGVYPIAVDKYIIIYRPFVNMVMKFMVPKNAEISLAE